MDTTYKRHSRRSHPNLQHLSLSPLTPHYPLPPTADDSPNSSSKKPTSYLSPQSLPQTPSILSRSPSRTRSHPRTSKSTHHLGALSEQFTPLSMSKSSFSLSQHHRPSAKPATKSSDSTDWLLQTASALTANTAESKGQSWLATRTSSTSLTDTPSYEPTESMYSFGWQRRTSGAEADDEFSPVSTRHQSRAVSRFASARNSRRGSRVGLMTPLGLRTPGEDEETREGFFEDMEPDFVDVEEGVGEEEVDEGEMRRLIKARVGGWWDYAVGWVDFRGEEGEGGEEDEGVDREEAGKGQEKDINGRRKRRRRNENNRTVLENQELKAKLDVPPPESGGLWKDTAWLLSVASKALVE